MTVLEIFQGASLVIVVIVFLLTLLGVIDWSDK